VAFFSRISAHLDMMQEMFRQTGALTRPGVSPHQASSLRQATQRCASCSNGEACRKWLDIGVHAMLEGREVPNFCPNQALQNEMKMER
jgi:hypothetical protein